MSITNDDSSRHAHGANQDKIWSYFQNEGVSSFDSAAPRLAFLLRQIARRSRAPRPKVLNIGAGGGQLETGALKRGWDMHTLDPDPLAIERLCATGVAAQQGYIERLPYSDGEFDCVVASEVLEHLTDDQRRLGLAEMARVLKPGCHVFVKVPANENLAEGRVVCPDCGSIFHRWGHQASFTPERLRSEMTPHFNICELRRTAFVDFASRSFAGRLKGIARLLLARAGVSIAVPTLFCAAQRS